MRFFNRLKKSPLHLSALLLGAIAASTAAFIFYNGVQFSRNDNQQIEPYRIVSSHSALTDFLITAQAAENVAIIPDFAVNAFVAEVSAIQAAGYSTRATMPTNQGKNSNLGILAYEAELIKTLSPEQLSSLTAAMREARPAVEQIAKSISDSNTRQTHSLLSQMNSGQLVAAMIAAATLSLFALFLLTAGRRNARMLLQSEALQSSDTKLQELSHFRQQFLANMSHEFRTPLNAIRGFSEAIVHQKDVMSMEGAVEYAQLISTSANDLTRLTDDVLDLSKIEDGKFTLKKEEVELTGLVEEATRQFATPAKQKDIQLDLAISEHFTILCDRDAMKRSLTHLLSNAIKFSDHGGRIVVRVRQRDPHLFTLEVRDYGCGIPQSSLSSIWMVYARPSETRNSANEGAGLGLALVKALTDEHGGFVELQSREGVGTAARLCLPSEMILSVRSAEEVLQDEAHQTQMLEQAQTQLALSA